MRRFSRISTIIALALIAALSAGCKKKKKAMPWLFFGAQQQTNPVDSNGNPLPNNQENGQQEVATSGPALITGSVVAMDGDSEESGFDYSSVEVQLVDPDGNVIARVHLNNSGQYSFQIPDLENNNYRVLLPSGQGLEGTHADFNYVYDPTSSPTLKEVAPIYAQITTFSMGPCVISGSVESPGYGDGVVSVDGGPLAGISVILYNGNGNPVSRSTTDSNGNFAFDLRDPENWLANGNYVIVAYGSEQESSGRPYKDVASGLDFIFQGNVQSTPTQISAGKLISAWDAATTSDANIKGSIYNVALDVDMDGFQVSLLSGNGTVLDSDTTNAAGEFELSETLGNGVYSIRVQKDGFQSVTTSIQFTARADGAETDINPEPIAVRPNNSKITGQITDATTGRRVDGAVISFRPAQDQPVERLQYLLDDPELATAAQRWIDEKQATGKYSTYLTQSYEVSGDHLQTTGVPGKWRFYISAPGYRPSSDPAGGDSGNLIVLNGADVHRSVALQSTTTRSRIEGRATITDILVDGTRNAYPGGVDGYSSRGTGLPGLIVVMLNNRDSSDRSVAHVTTTAADGSFVLGATHVLLSGDASSDAQRVAEAVTAYRQGQVLNTGLGTGSWANDSVYIDGGQAYFRSNSYTVYVVDPLGHLATSFITADNASVAQNSTGALLEIDATTAHLNRKQISGSVSNAISTVPVSGAQVELLHRTDHSEVYRDYDLIPAKNRLTDVSAHLKVNAVTTGNDGQFAFKNIDPGQYVLRITAPGYVNTEIDVNIPDDGSNPVVQVPVVPDGDPGNVTGKVQLPGGHDFTEPYTLEVVHPISGNRPTAGVQPASLSSGPTQFDNSPRYSIFGLKPGQWKIRFVSAGYKTVEGIVTVQSNATTTFDIITFVPGSHSPAPISGTVRNALNNRPVGGLSVRLRPGVSMQTGDYATDANGQEILAVQTTESGSYVIDNVPAGNYTLEVSGSGYSTTYRTVISAGVDTPSNQDVLISPVLGSDEVRVVLSWNEHPQDLDSHLEYGYSHPEQVVWNDKTKLNGDLLLDYDVVTGFGPETVTIKGSAWTQPRRGYSVFNWTRYRTPSYYSVVPISDSGATVRIYKSNGLVRTYHAGPDQIGKWWYLFCLDAGGAVIDAGRSGCSTADYFNAPYN